MSLFRKVKVRFSYFA